MQARQQSQDVSVEEETFGPMPLSRLEVNKKLLGLGISSQSVAMLETKL